MASGGPAGTADHTDTERTACLLTSEVERRLKTEIIFDKKDWIIYEKWKNYEGPGVSRKLCEPARRARYSNLIFSMAFQRNHLGICFSISHLLRVLSMSEIQPAEPPKDGLLFIFSNHPFLALIQIF
jgi:hypothetical protein